MTGLHLGFGLSVSADEYKSDVDVLGKVEYASGGEKWTFTGPRFDQLLTTTSLTATHQDVWSYRDPNTDPQPEYTYHYARWNTHNIEICSGEDNYTKVDDDSYEGNLGEFTLDCDGEVDRPGNMKTHTCTITLTQEVANELTKDFVEDVISTTSYGKSNKPIYGNETVSVYPTVEDTRSAYINTSKHLKARTNKIGGELKMSYFHNLTCHLALGVDICGTLNQKTKKNIGIGKLNYTEQPVTEITSSGYQISYNDDGTQFAKYVGQKFTASTIGEINSTQDKVNDFFKTETDEGGVTYIPSHTYTIESKGSESTVDLSGIIKDNPGYKELQDTPSDLSQYLQISNEKGGDVTFEKNKFNSRAAVVLGAQYKGWFAGLRGGVSYNQGKVHAKDVTGTATEDVSFAAPFVGVHLMKNVNMKGLENGNIYVTADVNVQNKQNLKMKGIKNFRQNSVNVSLGMTWKIK